ncbi:MAG: hypothetical protein OCC46_07210 [Pseudodesulfovibrio sp.]
MTTPHADLPALQRQRKLSAITAAALLITPTLFKAHEGFYEGHINGKEDMDLSSRRAGQGGCLSVIPDSVIHHHTICTPGRFDKENENFRIIFLRCRNVKKYI